MAKAKGKIKKARARRRAGAGIVDAAVIGELPKLDSLRDVPAFSDFTINDEQRAAFGEFVQTLRVNGDDAAADAMRIGWVVRLDRGFPLVATDGLTLRAEHAVAFAKGADMLPAIGDCVVVRCDSGHDMGVIERVLPRRTVFERWRGKNRGERQVLAANVDTILVVQPLGSVRDTLQLVRDRIARSLVLIRDCGATPVVVLTKADRCDEGELATYRSEIERLNTLLGHEALATSGVRERDDMGRHTTVARVMVSLPEPCGVIADAPGLRSLPLVGHERGLARTFPEIVEAARACRFNDCTHTHEPGCAVREAVAAGEIDELRVEAFLSLAREMRVSAQSLDPDIHL